MSKLLTEVVNTTTVRVAGRVAGLVASLALLGCSQSGSSPSAEISLCSSGRVCGPGWVCAPDEDKCMLESCGNGIWNLGEECDDSFSDSCVELDFNMGNPQCSSSCSVSGCTRFNWEPMTPAPDWSPSVEIPDCLQGYGHQLLRVWADAPDNIFAVGFLGEDVNLQNLFTDTSIVAVAAKPGLITHFDGERWTTWIPDIGGDPNEMECTLADVDGNIPKLPTSTNMLLDVWGTPDGQVFAVGAFGTILRYDGTSWESLDVAPRTSLLTGIWGTSGGELFVVGSYMLGTSWDPDCGCDVESVVMHFDGENWEQMPAPPEYALYGVWGIDTNNVVTAGRTGVYRYDGEQWHKAQFTEPKCCNSDGDSEHCHTGDLFSAWGTAQSDTWFFTGDRGSIVRLDPVTDTICKMALDTPIRPNALFLDVWGASETDVYAVGSDGIVVHYDGNDQHLWRHEPQRTNHLLSGIFGTDENEVFIAGEENTILRSTDTRLTRMNLPSFPDDGTLILNDLWGQSIDDIFAVGAHGDSRIILRHNGQRNTWQRIYQSQGAQLHRIQGVDTGDVFAFGSDGAFLHAEPGNFTSWTDLSPQPDTTGNLNDVWASDSGRMIVVGGDGIWLRNGGGNWQSTSPGPGYFTAVWGRNETEIYVVGADIAHSPPRGTIWLLEDGTSWRTVFQTQLDNELRRIEATPMSPTSLFVAGVGGSFLICDELPCDREDSWQNNLSESPGTYLSLAVATRDDAFVSADFGLVEHYDGQQLSRVLIDDRLTASINATWVSPDGATAIFASEDGNIYRLDRTQ